MIDRSLDVVQTVTVGGKERRAVRFVPKCCQAPRPAKLKALKPGETPPEAEYEGHVVLLLPDYWERMDLQDDGEDAMPEGHEAMTPEEIEEWQQAKRRKRTAMKLMGDVARKAGPFIHEIRVVRKDDGFVFDSYDKLVYDSDGFSILTEIAGRLIGKYAEGKTSIPS